jgi:hypothetical protein
MVKRRTLATAVAVLLLIGAAGGLAAYVLRSGESEAATDQGQDAELVLAAKAALQSRMADAQSVAFGKVFVHRVGDLPSVCGRVDIQQEQDGFDGQERFIYSEGQVLIEEAEGDDVLDRRWDDLCA